MSGDGYTIPPDAVVSAAGCNGVGPWICDYPKGRQRGDHWTCPECGTEYRLSRPISWRWWRNWAAPNGQWKLVHPWRVPR